MPTIFDTHRSDRNWESWQRTDLSCLLMRSTLGRLADEAAATRRWARRATALALLAAVLPTALMFWPTDCRSPMSHSPRPVATDRPAGEDGPIDRGPPAPGNDVDR